MGLYNDRVIVLVRGNRIREGENYGISGNSVLGCEGWEE